MLPNLLHLGHLTLPTFGVLAALGLMLALQLSLVMARRYGLDPERVWNAGLFLVLAAFVMSRVLLVATNWSSFRAYPILLLMVPSLTPLGLLLAAVAGAVWMWARQLPVLRMLDVWAPCATLVWAFLALGHLAEGSDPGMPAARFGLPLRPGGPRAYPVAVLAAVAASGLTLLLLRLRVRGPGALAAAALLGAGLAQFLLTFLREPYPYPPPVKGLLDPIQWVALGMIAMSAVVYVAGSVLDRSPGEAPYAV